MAEKKNTQNTDESAVQAEMQRVSKSNDSDMPKP